MKYFFILILFLIIIIPIFSDTIEMVNIGINDTLQMEYVIIDGSLLIKNSNFILKIEQDYEFKNGNIKFNINSDSLIIIYQPVNPQIKYRNFIYKKMEKDAINDSILFNDHLALSRNENIYFGGIKGFMVNVGNSGNVTMNQTLELNIEGNVSDRWILSGYIYDDGTQGVLNTYNIPVSQIENINISIYDSLNMFSLGNNTFTGYQGKFTMRNREILGVYGNIKKGQLGFKGAIAGQKGQFRQIEFYCYDNVQGPYLLVEEITLAEYIIAPGSEKIYINGERLIEGDDNDYTINYQNGELYFTPQRIVDSNTLIYVEFQTYEGSHPITGYYGGFSAMDSIVNLIYIREEQNIIDEDDREIFETIHSDSSKVFLGSIEYVGDNLGDYFYNDSILVFAGFNSGDYDARFFYIGMGNGDYIFNPLINAYVYAGPKNGNYLPGRFVNIPFESNYFAGNVKYPVGNGYLLLNAGGGFYKRNRYALLSPYDKDISYLAEYNSGLINFGIISASTALKRVFLSTLYRDVWFERDNEDADYLAKTGNLSGAEVQNIITVNMNYSRYLRTNMKISFADSLTSKTIKLQTDSVWGIRTGFIKRRDAYGKNNIYKLNNYNIRKKIFMFLPAYIYETEYRNATDYTRHKGILGLGNYFTISYINEKQYMENNLKKIDACDLKTSFSFLKTNADINGQYRHTEDNSQIKNNLFMRLNINGIIIPQWTYSQHLLLTSVSDYMISESYIYAGLGKGDYVYDTLSGDYVFDEFEGEYIKIIENVISSTPVAKREYGVKTDFFTNSINAFSQIRYSDNALTVGSFNSNYIYNKNIYEFTHIEYKMTNGLSPFIEHQYLSNNQMENSEMITQMLKGGINRIGGNIFYSIYSSYSSELNTNSFGTNQHYIVKDISGTGTMKETKWTIELMVVLRDLLGSYRDNYIEIDDIGIRGSTVGIGAKYNIYKALYIRIKPEATFNMYNENYDEIPLTLYYRYPEELSFKGEITIGWHNDFISLTGRYSSEITEKNGFRQKADINLYTYF